MPSRPRWRARTSEHPSIPVASGLNEQVVACAYMDVVGWTSDMWTHPSYDARDHMRMMGLMGVRGDCIRDVRTRGVP
jgi:hypothetical protein